MNGKLRLILSLTAALLILVVWDVWRTSTRPRWVPSAGTSGQDTRRIEKRCRRLFDEFCRTRPDFGIGTFTDPTGEVWLDSESEAAIREAIASSPDWISSVFSEKRKGRIIEIERWVKTELARWIQEQPETVFRARDRRELLARLQSTHLDFPSPKLGYPDEPDLLMNSQAIYERLENHSHSPRRLRFGAAYVLGASSRFNLVFTIAHELAHAIDPCELRSTGWAVPAFDRLSSCFITAGLAATPKSRIECRRNDQLSETFADWVAVKISARALKQWGSEYPEPQRWAAVGNSIRDLCEEDHLAEESETHPSPRIRIEKILGTDPEIRTYLGCSASVPACSLE
jgi:hypothetical protein